MESSEQLQHSLGERYRLERELGGGGMARVFLARDEALHRSIVVKMIRPELASAVSSERFAREIHLAASLQHPHIVPLLETGTAAGVPFYTMPFVAGETLRERLDRAGPLTVPEAFRTLRDIAQALQYAHERGVVHRDIKPANVMLSGGVAVVTDFGIAKALGDAGRQLSSPDFTLTDVDLRIGTPAYMSPEQASGAPDLDQRADIYSFGVMAWEALTGRSLFTGSTPQQVMMAHVSQTPPPVNSLRPELPTELGALVMRCVEKDPAHRPQSANDILRDLALAERASHAQHEPHVLRRVLVVYALTFLFVTGLSYAAVSLIGLPDWVMPGTLIILSLGFLALAFTGLARRFSQATPIARNAPVAPTPVSTRVARRVADVVTWRRLALGGGGVLAAFGLFVAGYMVLRTLGIGPAGTLFAAGTLDISPRLLLTDFSVRSADTALALPATHGVRTVLGQSEVFDLVDGVDVSDALRRMRRPPESPLDVDLAREIAERDGYPAIIAGDLTGTGGQFIISLRLINAADGRLLAGPFQTQTANLIDGVDEVARDLRAKIGESLRTVRATPRLHQLTTTSVEALRLYAQAIQTPQARARVPILRRAVAADSMFVTAWRSMAIAMSNAGYPTASVDTAASMAYRFRDRVPDRERYFAEATYFALGPGADRRRAIESWESLSRIDSGSGVINNLGMETLSRRNWARAESLFRKSLEVSRVQRAARRTRGRPDAGSYENILVALVNRGALAEAESVAVEATDSLPQNYQMILGGLRARYARGTVTAYERAVDSLRAAGDGGRGPITTRASMDVAQLRGQLDRASGLSAELAALESRMGVPQHPMSDSLRFAYYDVWYRGNRTRAISRSDALLAQFPLASMPPAARPYGPLSIVYALAGRPEKARALLAQLTGSNDSLLIRRSYGTIHLALGEILLAEGRAREALVEFRRADTLPDGPVDADPLRVLANVGRAFDLAGDADSAMYFFERYLETPYQYRIGGKLNRGSIDPYYPPDAVFLAGILKRLGELYDAKGDRDKAASYHARFIELWDRADPALQPRVADARQRLQRLSKEGARNTPPR